MLVVHSPEEVARVAPRVVLAAGYFDGLHRGHCALLSEAIALAERRDAQAWVLTFDPHPLSVVAPERCPPRLMTLSERLETLRRMAGLSGCLVLPFTEAFAALTPMEFIRHTLGAWLGAGERYCGVVSGPNWHFGQGHSGTLSDLQRMTDGAVEILEVPFVIWNGAPVSSTRIRAAILGGDLESATAMLGRPYRICEHSGPAPARGIGTRLGAPTANVLVQSALMPPVGVYAVDVRVEGEAETDSWHRAVANYGYRPTFPDARPDRPVLEVHILGHEGALYGARFEIAFLKRLRGERAFETPSALGAQIRLDIAQAQAFPRSEDLRHD